LPYQENKDFETVIGKVADCLKEGLPFCIYRKPNQSQITAIFQSEDALHSVVDFSENGFVFAPFQFENGAVLLKPDEIFVTQLEHSEHSSFGEIQLSEIGRNDHLELIKKGIEEINTGRLSKVVLSRKLEAETKLSPPEIFTQLLQHYPNAFCYLFHHPKIGTWCGATPETLMTIQNREIKTMSLAATLPFVEGEVPQWKEKELEEQQMVSDYIRERLAGLMESLDIEEAKSVRAGNLWHLKSKINGKMLPKTSVNKIVSLLHPTPAVCGIPTQEAKEFILKHENYRRTYYTGFLGELNLSHTDGTSLYVNLRCMELKGQTASIYVGGGITKASDPEREWVETQNKSKTMLNIL
jgi:isochorismate synthase